MCNQIDEGQLFRLKRFVVLLPLHLFNFVSKLVISFNNKKEEKTMFKKTTTKKQAGSRKKLYELKKKQKTN